MKVVLEINLPVGVAELAAVVDVLAEIHKAHVLIICQAGPFLQIYYDPDEVKACLDEPTSGQ